MREWAKGYGSTSRLAIYSSTGYARNRREFTDAYLPLLTKIAGEMNALSVPYTCAVTGQHKKWRPVDVEMAAYYWWACHGSR